MEAIWRESVVHMAAEAEERSPAKRNMWTQTYEVCAPPQPPTQRHAHPGAPKRPLGVREW